MRRSLVALSDDQAALARALVRHLEVARLGCHPIGNLVLQSLAGGFGDLAEASRWLGHQLGIDAVVLPATAEPVSLLAVAGTSLVRGESAIGAVGHPIRSLSFEPPRPRVHDDVLTAISRAELIVLAPGSLFTSVLAASAVPDIALAIARTAARVVWISNLRRDGAGESAGMSAAGHLDALCAHGVRLDAVLYDPTAELAFEPEQLRAAGLDPYPRPLRHGGRVSAHDPKLLQLALDELIEDYEQIRPNA
jgi:uncharacterized cofD-like protein